MTFALVQLTETELHELAASGSVAHLAERLEHEALPPSFIAAKALELGAQGWPLPWATTFLIVRDSDDRIVGSCSFKTAPEKGRVEIGYGVAESARSAGAATAAVHILVAKAWDAGATEVLAETLPDNYPSIRVVEKAGFENIGSRVDAEDGQVLQWLKRSQPALN